MFVSIVVYAVICGVTLIVVPAFVANLLLFRDKQISLLNKHHKLGSRESELLKQYSSPKHLTCVAILINQMRVI